MEQPVAALVKAGLSPEQAFDTYSAIAVHIRGSVVLERLQERVGRRRCDCAAERFATTVRRIVTTAT
jgi:hypothetical protein